MNLNTPKLRFRRLIDGDVKNDINMNRNVDSFDLLANLVLESITVTAQPASAVVGTAYYVPSGATGAQWAKVPGHIVLNTTTGMLFVPIFDGCRAWVKDLNLFQIYFGGQWRSFGVLRKAVVMLPYVTVNANVRHTLFKSLNSCTIIDARFQDSTPSVNLGTPTMTLGYSSSQTGGATTIASSWDGQGVGTIVNATTPSGSYVWLTVTSVVSPAAGLCLVVSYVENI